MATPTLNGKTALSAGAVIPVDGGYAAFGGPCDASGEFSAYDRAKASDSSDSRPSADGAPRPLAPDGQRP